MSSSFVLSTVSERQFAAICAPVFDSCLIIYTRSRGEKRGVHWPEAVVGIPVAGEWRQWRQLPQRPRGFLSRIVVRVSSALGDLRPVLMRPLLQCNR